MAPCVRAMQQKRRQRASLGSKYPKGDLTSFFLTLAARGYEPRHILDVGANMGKWSRDAHRIFPKCRFTLLEPQVEMKPHLDKFCRRCPQARWILGGAGDFTGQQTFTVEPTSFSSSFATTAEEAAEHGYEQRVVPIYTLDYLVARQIGETPDIVKIDAEGYESRIIQGARTLLGRAELILLEAHFWDERDNPSSFISLVNLMDQHDYVPYDFTWFGKRQHDGAVGLCEIAFARRHGVLRQHQGWSAPIEARAA